MKYRDRFRAGVKLALAVVVLAALSCPASAQKKKDPDAGTRAVQGSVMGADDKLVVGAVVQLKDMRTLQIRSFITQTDGAYHFTGLKMDVDYQIKADYQGLTSGAKTLSLFDDRKTPIINLKVDKK